MKKVLFWCLIIVALNILIIVFNYFTSDKTQNRKAVDISIKSIFKTKQRKIASSIPKSIKTFKQYCETIGNSSNITGTYYEQDHSRDTTPYIEIGCNMRNNGYVTTINFTEDNLEIYKKLCAKSDKDRINIKIKLDKNGNNQQVNILCHRYL